MTVSIMPTPPNTPLSRPGTPILPPLPKSSPPLVGVSWETSFTKGTQVGPDPNAITVKLDSLSELNPWASRPASPTPISPVSSPASSRPVSPNPWASRPSSPILSPGRPISPMPVSPNPWASRPGSPILPPNRPIGPRPISPNPWASQGPRLKGFSGKTLGELSNLLGEISSLMVAYNQATPGSTALNFLGESLFSVGGMWQFYSGLKELERRKNWTLIFDYIQGAANTVSGISGAASSFSETPVGAGKTSQIAWAIGEGTNMIRQTQEYFMVGENWIDEEQSIRIAQFMASTFKLAGIVTIYSGGSSKYAFMELAGTLIGASSGIANLRHKGHFTTLNLTAVRKYREMLVSMQNIATASRMMSHREGVENLV